MSQPRRSPSSRRAFLRAGLLGAGALAVPWVVPASALGRGGAPSPNDRIGIGVIGVGGRGGWHLVDLVRRPQCRVVAVCDAHSGRLDAARRGVDAAGAGGGCGAHVDFRELLARTDVDAVVIASPDHWHAIQTVSAARAGKDIYCEKPLTHTVEEGKAVVAAVRRHGVVFQHGTQQRSEASFRKGAELVLNGRIGKLRTIRLGVPSGQSIGPQAPTPVPPDLDYEMWLGPAPWAPHTPKRVESSHSWYWISDYCVGYIAGWGVHHVDSAQQGNGTDLTGPVEVEGTGVFPKEGLYDTAVRWRLEFRFPNGVTMVDADVSSERMGVTYEGSEGTVYTWRDDRLETRPASLREETIGPGERRVYRSDDHLGNFLECIRTRGETAAPVEVAHRSTTMCTIGAIALRLGRRLRWDPRAERFVGDDEANRLLFRPYREPWRL